MTNKIENKTKMDRQEIQTYINNFRRLFSRFLKPDVGIQSTVYPFDKGSVIVYELGLNLQNKDDLRSNSKEITEALKRTNLFENEKGDQIHSFVGTNILLIKNKIVVIKDENPNEWTEEKAQLDIEKIIQPSKDKING
jgi:hypothetical protein